MKITLWRLAAATTLAAAVAMIAFDEPLARAMRGLEASAIWDDVLGIIEYVTGISPWKWSMPVLLGAACALTLAIPALRRQAHAWLYVMFVYLATQNATLWLKTLTGRWRPREWLEVGGPMFGHIGAGFSFPSGHVTLVGGLLVPIAIAWPRTRLLAVAVVLFVMIARIATGAHFLSDVLGGLALVLAIAAAARPILTATYRTASDPPPTRSPPSAGS